MILWENVKLNANQLTHPISIIEMKDVSSKFKSLIAIQFHRHIAKHPILTIAAKFPQNLFTSLKKDQRKY